MRVDEVGRHVADLDAVLEAAAVRPEVKEQKIGFDTAENDPFKIR